MGNFQIKKKIYNGVEFFSIALSMASAINPYSSPVGTIIGYANNLLAKKRLDRLIKKHGYALDTGIYNISLY